MLFIVVLNIIALLIKGSYESFNEPKLLEQNCNLQTLLLIFLLIILNNALNNLINEIPEQANCILPTG